MLTNWTASEFFTSVNFASLSFTEEYFGRFWTRRMNLRKISRCNPLNELRYTTFGANWNHLVESCIFATGVNFSLEESEVELFNACKTKHMICKTEMSRKVENILYSNSQGFVLSKICDSKCHNYLEYADLFTTL